MVAVNDVPEPEIFALHELPTLTEFAVPIFIDQPLTLELPLLVTVKLAVKPPPQSLTLTAQPRPPLPPLDELELLDELEELEELEDELEDEELEELELLEDEPPQLPTAPPSPYWSLQVLIPIQLWLFSHPQPLVWFWHIGRTSPYQLHTQAPPPELLDELELLEEELLELLEELLLEELLLDELELPPPIFTL